MKKRVMNAAAAAVLALSMALMTGCGSGSGNSSSESVKVGLLHSMTGSMAISEQAVLDAEKLAIKEINESGGVLGKQIEYQEEDGASDPSTFASKAEKLVDQDGISTVFGCWTSSSRKAVKSIFEDYDALLFYPVQYEGMESSSNIVYTGAAPNQQIVPAIEYLIDQGYTKYFLLGSDYVFPRTANMIIQAQLEAAKENGIPVVAFDSGVSDSKMIRAFRGTDNTRVGEIAAYRLAVSIGKMGKVAVFSAQEKTQSIQERVAGFTDYIANYPDIEVVDVIYQDQVDDMTAAMQEVLDKNPQLDGVFCTNADISDMYLDMEKDETKDPVVIVGVDATAKQQDAIRNNKEVGVVSQQPYAMGYQTIWTALMTTAPKKSVEITRNVRIDPAWIDGSVIDDPAYSAYLYAN